ncbi:biotin carboxylase [Kitasatospora sp. MAP5-34]|uniref:ATP-grasp domain-containing protein n=1 Tax=Kitasatospora sp. MAP5-34 TaxID=3035102 RepID=UPI002475140C|nr:biotin carboxylase [Kitasatospora sp. MAP5-34]MDH6574464.1 biotin carboxylase [Kitasatospora sp. MAP5-34]
MSPRTHVVVIHRWRARYAEYARYLDHERYAVSYLTTEIGVEAVPDAAVEVVTVAATDDMTAVRKEVDALASRHGPPRHIVALKEDDLLVAAELAAEWGCPGRSPGELMVFRDKLLMAGAVAAAGVALPAFAPATDQRSVRAFAELHGWPVVLKPRIGSSSEGVVKIASADELAAVVVGAGLMVQAYNPHRIYHVDGVFDGTALGPWRASRYLNSCLGFREGDPLGSVEEDDPEVLVTIGEFTDRVLRALSASALVFHLEVFVEDRDGGPPGCAFLEIGARVGGAEIPFLWREVHGYDLMEAAFRIALGQPPQPWHPVADDEVGGWLLAPAPTARPCRIQEATSMLGRTPGPYAQALPAPGEVVPAADAYYEHVGGRFRFRGATSAAVEEAVLTTARDFRVRAEPVPGRPAVVNSTPSPAG